MKASKKPRTVTKKVLSQEDDNVHFQVKEKRQCGYCGLRDGHWYEGGCKIMSETGYLLRKTEVDNFRIKLTQCEHDI